MQSRDERDQQRAHEHRVAQRREIHVEAGKPDRNVLAALLSKHAEIAEQIEHAQSELHKLRIALDNVEATIWLFDSTIDLKTVKAKRLPTHHQAYRGEVARIVLGTLRKAQEPIPAREIVAEVFAARGLSATDKALYREIYFDKPPALPVVILADGRKIFAGDAVGGDNR
jgi:hypothetical protein